MSLPFGKHWSNLQTVSELKLCFGLRKCVGVIIFFSDFPEIQEGRETPPLP